MAKTNITKMFPNWADVNSIEKGSNICHNTTVRVPSSANDPVGLIFSGFRKSIAKFSENLLNCIGPLTRIEPFSRYTYDSRL